MVDENSRLFTTTRWTRGVDALYQEVKKLGKPYNTKTKSGFTWDNIKEWYSSREKVQIHRRISGYHSFAAEKSQL